MRNSNYKYLQIKLFNSTSVIGIKRRLCNVHIDAISELGLVS